MDYQRHEQEAWEAFQRDPNPWSFLTAFLASAARKAAERRSNG